MKKVISLSAIALVSVIVMATLVVGVYGAVTGGHTLHDSGAQHRGWAASQDSIAHVEGQGRDNLALPSDLTNSNGRRGEGKGQQAKAEPQIQVGDWPTYKGTLVEMDDHLILETEDGQTIELGTGPSTYFETLDFTLSVGDQIAVSGFHEDGEFKVQDLTNDTTGQSITLRDSTGRPAWAGQGRRQNAY